MEPPEVKKARISAPNAPEFPSVQEMYEFLKDARNWKWKELNTRKAVSHGRNHERKIERAFNKVREKFRRASHDTAADYCHLIYKPFLNAATSGIIFEAHQIEMMYSPADAVNSYSLSLFVNRIFLHVSPYHLTTMTDDITLHHIVIPNTLVMGNLDLRKLYTFIHMITDNENLSKPLLQEIRMPCLFCSFFVNHAPHLVFHLCRAPDAIRFHFPHCLTALTRQNHGLPSYASVNLQHILIPLIDLADEHDNMGYERELIDDYLHRLCKLNYHPRKDVSRIYYNFDLDCFNLLSMWHSDCIKTEIEFYLSWLPEEVLYDIILLMIRSKFFFDVE